MALSKIRAQINGQWYTLSYNSATRKYEAELIFEGSSTLQPGGYFNVTVEATNETGSVVTADGNTFPGLRLVLRETTPPTVTLISPASQYVTSAPASIVAEITDSGSGVNPDTLSLLIDGNPVAFSLAAATSGYRITYSSILSEGVHTLIVSGQDYDGNTGERRFSFTVDTVPPELEAKETRGKLLVDEESVTVTGHANDATTGVVLVSVSCGGKTEEATLFPSGMYVHHIPLKVGLNEIAVTAQDAAGLRSVVTIPVIRLITDRDEEDRQAFDALLAKRIEEWTEQEKADFSEGVYKASYDFSDINRVVMAEQYLADALRKAGYSVTLTATSGWEKSDAYTLSEERRYLSDLTELRGIVSVPAETPEVPKRLSASARNVADGLNLNTANDIEKILVLADTSLALAGLSGWYAGEIFCGEV